MEDLKGVGTNVLFVAEENTGQHGTGLFEENLADTVIRLSVQKRHDYAQRYFEITKSRLQREQRGNTPSPSPRGWESRSSPLRPP